MAQPSNKKIAAAFKTLWDMPEGRLALGYLIGRSGVMMPFMEPSNDGGKPYTVTDPVAMGICEGERRMGLEIARLLSSKPEDFVDLSKQIRDVFEGTGEFEIYQ